MSTDLLWAAVDQLVKPCKVRIVRNVDRISWPDWAHLPSLWEMLVDASAARTDGSGEGRGGSPYRSPAAVDCLELAGEIRDVVVDALAGHDVKPRTTGKGTSKQVDLPAALRQLASTVATVAAADPSDDLADFWMYRVRSWCNRIRVLLRLTGDPQPRRLRDTACPTCKATHVTEMVDGEPQRVPPLLIDFEDGLVRAVTCSACSDAWFRGDALHELAALLRRDTRSSDVVA